MSGPKISVIVPVYNAENYLSKCLDSILAQTFKDFEVLLVDDGSSDGSSEICDKYADIDSRIRVFHQQNRGVASARQRGLVEAVGEYSIHVDSDDWIESRMLEEMYNYAVSENADLVLANFWVEKDGRLTHVYQNQANKDGRELLKQIVGNRIFGSLWNKLIRHRLYREYDIAFVDGINYCEDVLLLSQLLQHTLKCVHINEPFYHYCMDNLSSITRNYTQKTFETRLLFLEKLKMLLPYEDFEEEIDLQTFWVKDEAVYRGFLALKDYKKILPVHLSTIMQTELRWQSKLKYIYYSIF